LSLSGGLVIGSVAGLPGVVPAAVAQSAPAEGTLQEVVVTATPPGGGGPGGGPPASVLTGRALDARRAGTLGETLASEPGVSSTYYGPNASRPVIRGQDGDRIRITQNGGASLDASALSFDHATTVEPLVTERFEVLRGPAALRFGGNAIGGVVNAIDNRIPTAPIDAPGGRVEARAGGAERETSGVAVIEAGNGAIAVHADAYRRASADLAIPGFARSARQRALDDPAREQPYGRLPNTFSRAEGGALGASATWDKGYLGMSAGTYRSSYGGPADPSVMIDLRKDTVDLAGEMRGLAGPIESLRVRVGHTDYEHQEKQKAGGAVNTTFANRGHDARIEARHAPLGPIAGTIGVQFGQVDFSALGAEAYVPSTATRTQALFVLEEWSQGPWTLNGGARVESTQADSRGDLSAPGLARFGPPQSRRFAAQSLSLGGQYAFDARWSLAASLAATERAPSSAELFANGPHGATGTYEVGNPAFDKERATAFDLTLRRREGANLFSLGAYRTRFSNYLMLAPTGRLRGDDGSLENPATPGTTSTGAAADLPEYAYRQVPALFEGTEMLARWRLRDTGGTLDLETRLDTVRASQRDTGAPLPRIAPLRVGVTLIHQSGPVHTRAELAWVAAQKRVAANELPTDGYALVNVYAAYRFKTGGPIAWEAFVRGNNLTNAEARTHASLLKDIAPLGGRSVLVGVRGYF
jgi:iron complex outermembrane receptor protein